MSGPGVVSVGKGAKASLSMVSAGDVAVANPKMGRVGANNWGGESKEEVKFCRYPKHILVVA